MWNISQYIAIYGPDILENIGIYWLILRYICPVDTSPVYSNIFHGHLNATFGGKDMGSMAQTGLLLVPPDALGHTCALLGALGGGQGLPPPNWPEAP